MEVILLERVAKLGQMGEIVRVKDGFARNFLLPRGKALRATEANKKHFEGQRAQLEARNLERKSEAEAVAEKLDGQSFIIIRQAGETGQLYGSVSTRDIAEAITAGGFTSSAIRSCCTRRSRRSACTRCRSICIPRSTSKITINVARSPEEADARRKGESAVTREETSMADLGLEVGAALAEAGDGASLIRVKHSALQAGRGAVRPAFATRGKPRAGVKRNPRRRRSSQDGDCEDCWIMWTCPAPCRNCVLPSCVPRPCAMRQSCDCGFTSQNPISP